MKTYMGLILGERITSQHSEILPHAEGTTEVDLLQQRWVWPASDSLVPAGPEASTPQKKTESSTSTVCIHNT